jgi:hypothetical protein
LLLFVVWTKRRADTTLADLTAIRDNNTGRHAGPARAICGSGMSPDLVFNDPDEFTCARCLATVEAEESKAEKLGSRLPDGWCRFVCHGQQEFICPGCFTTGRIEAELVLSRLGYQL